MHGIADKETGIGMVSMMSPYTSGSQQANCRWTCIDGGRILRVPRTRERLATAEEQGGSDVATGCEASGSWSLRMMLGITSHTWAVAFEIVAVPDALALDELLREPVSKPVCLFADFYK